MDIRRRVAAAIDERIMTSLLGTSTVAQSPQDPLTLDKIRKMRLALPKAHTFLSTRLCPGPDALRIEGSGEDFTIAHPMFWARFEYESNRIALDKSDLLGMSRPLFGVPIIEIDVHETDCAERIIFVQMIWERLIDAIKVASIPLPDWLKAPPRFGKHG